MIALLLLILSSAPVWAHQREQVLECMVTRVESSEVRVACPDGLVLHIPQSEFPYQPAHFGQDVNLDRTDLDLYYSGKQPGIPEMVEWKSANIERFEKIHAGSIHQVVERCDYIVFYDEAKEQGNAIRSRVQAVRAAGDDPGAFVPGYVRRDGEGVPQGASNMLLAESTWERSGMTMEQRFTTFLDFRGRGRRIVGYLLPYMPLARPFYGAFLILAST